MGDRPGRRVRRRNDLLTPRPRSRSGDDPAQLLTLRNRSDYADTSFDIVYADGWLDVTALEQGPADTSGVAVIRKLNATYQYASLGERGQVTGTFFIDRPAA